MLLLLVSMQNIAFANDDSAQQAFDQAISAFKFGKYKFASRFFELARQQGLDTPALNYNLGVTYYKLKKYPQARQAFERAAQGNRWQALAYYNIGLIAYRQKDNAEARKYAQKVLKLFTDEKLERLALKLLEKASPASGSDYWIAEVSAGLGYDSNVALTNDNSTLLATNDSDTFFDVSARMSKNYHGGTLDGLNIYGGIYRTDYQKENDFDLTGIEGGISKNFLFTNWDLDVGGNWEYLDLDGSPFYRAGELIVVGTAGNPKHKGLELSYRLKRFDEGDSDFEYLRGWQTAVAIASAYQFGDVETSYGYDLQIDRRENLILNGQEYSFSPTTHTLFGRINMKFDHGLQAAINMEAGQAQYSTEDVRTGQEPETRQDSYYEIVLQGSWDITSSWRTLIELSHLDNQSNIDEFDYDRNVFTVFADLRF